jgi:hypothetical protein
MSAVPTPATINSQSTSNPKVVASSGERVIAGSLNLPISQAISLPAKLRHEILTVQSSSTPNFNSFYNIDLRDVNLILHNITLQFVLGPVVGSTGLVGCFNPAFQFINHIDLVQSNVIIQTIHGDQQFLMNQILEYDEDRLSLNALAGAYNSVAQRTLLSSQTGTNTFYVNLRTYFDECKMNILTSAHNIQLRVYLEPLANCFAVTSGTLTSCNFISAAAICSITRLDTQSAQARLADMSARSNHNVFHDLNYFTYNIPTGTKRSVTILSGIVGSISCIYFTVRASTATNQKWVFKQIESFALLNGASTNIIGGQEVSASLCANYLNMRWCKSSYNNETAFGTNDQYANFYCWSFSVDPIASLTNGQALGTYRFTGQEQLVINLSAAATANLQVDFYAYNEMILATTPFSVKKESL